MLFNKTVVGCVCLFIPFVGQPVFCQDGLNAPLSITAFAPSVGQSQEPAKCLFDDDEWEIKGGPYAWLLSVDGDSTVNGQTAAVDLSFSDLMSDFDVFAMSGKVEMTKRDWTLAFGGGLSTIKGDFKLLRPGADASVDVDIRDNYFEFGAYHKTCEIPLDEDGSGRMFTFEPLVGGRYRYFKQEIELNVAVPGVGSVGKTFGGDEEWVEPFVGGRISYDLTDDLAAVVRTDVGGFGLGSAPDISFNLWTSFHYELNKKTTLVLGYLYQRLDYSRGSGSREFG
ncbi:MAG: hypothetical protein KAR47_15900, partial [Planctomycetes bacterium]|nr:hypothetical protein [Planctomycetota bacterium]